jgi:hypothetical protein
VNSDWGLVMKPRMIAILAMALAASPTRLLRWMAVLDATVDFSGVCVEPGPDCRHLTTRT